MVQYLVVIDESDASSRLLREAGAIAEALEAEILVVALTVDDGNEETVEAMWDQVRSSTATERPDSPWEIVRTFADRISERAFEDSSVNYRTQGEFIETMRPSDRIIEIAESHGCDHIFMPGKRRSPTGKAIFGDTTQSIILNFDGFVTVAGD